MSDEPSAPSPPASRRARRLGVALALLGVVVVVGVVVVTRLVAGPDERRYVIPAGTADRVAAGETVDVLPSEIDLDRGDTLTIVNRDDVTHYLGVRGVPPGTTVSQVFGRPGEFQAVCTVHTKGSLVISVH